MQPFPGWLSSSPILADPFSGIVVPPLKGYGKMFIPFFVMLSDSINNSIIAIKKILSQYDNYS